MVAAVISERKAEVITQSAPKNCRERRNTEWAAVDSRAGPGGCRGREVRCDAVVAELVAAAIHHEMAAGAQGKVSVFGRMAAKISERTCMKEGCAQPKRWHVGGLNRVDHLFSAADHGVTAHAASSSSKQIGHCRAAGPVEARVRPQEKAGFLAPKQCLSRCEQSGSEEGRHTRRTVHRFGHFQAVRTHKGRQAFPLSLTPCH